MTGTTPAPTVPQDDSLENSYSQGFTDTASTGKPNTAFGGMYGPLSNKVAGPSGTMKLPVVEPVR